MLENKRLQRNIDNIKMYNEYYSEDMRNQWEFWIGEALNELGIIGSSKIITGGSDTLYNDYEVI